MFNDIKNELEKIIYINEKKFISEMLNFYVNSEDKASIKSIKKCFNDILHSNFSDNVILID